MQVDICLIKIINISYLRSEGQTCEEYCAELVGGELRLVKDNFYEMNILKFHFRILSSGFLLISHTDNGFFQVK